MKPVLFFVSAALALAAAPASADNGQVFSHAAQQQAYPSPAEFDGRSCFNGKSVAGANRIGYKTVYVQASKGAIFELQLARSCPALNAAEKLTVRSSTGNAVCSRGSAELVVQTPAGARRCSVSDVRRLTSHDVAVLSTAPRR